MSRSSRLVGKPFALIPFPLAVRPDRLPPPSPALRAVVVIPARNEADLLPLALRALQGQVDGVARPLDRGTFEVIILANNCTDRTADVARAVVRDEPDGPPIHVVEVEVPRSVAHVGTARRWLMDRAAERLEGVGHSAEGLILSTDADTVVDPDWIAAQHAEVAAGADAVAGRIEVDCAELRRLGRDVWRSHMRELLYRGRVLQLEALIDPNPLDPPPRHDFHGGASLGITARCYRKIGGLPPLASLEDVALAEALWRADARFVHSCRVRVRTSPRLDPRAEGGYGRSLASGASAEAPVRALGAIEGELRTRATLRHYFRLKLGEGPTWRPDPSGLHPLADECGLTPNHLGEVMLRESTFGRWLEVIRGFGSGPPRPFEPRVSIAQALRDLRDRVRALRRAAGSA